MQYDLVHINSDLDTLLSGGGIGEHPSAAQLRHVPKQCKCGMSKTNQWLDVVQDLLVCPHCGLIDNIPAGCEWVDLDHRSVFRPDRGKKHSAVYNPTYYSNEKLRNANATDPACVASFYEAVRLVGGYLSGGDPTQLSKDRIRRIAKLLGCKEYGERWWKIKKKVCCGRLRQQYMSEHTIYWLQSSFEQYKTAFQHMVKYNMFKKKRSKNLLHYNYVYTQLLKIHDAVYGTDWLKKHGWWFNLVKTRKRIVQCDEDWEQVLEYLNREHNTCIPFFPLADSM